ncbi:thiolase family protein [Clostridium botulinum]|uniref:acetyl-CoA C-acetyltransferase n=1 Tax=Clostridium botulinum TaxID=1491 RepID=A0A9Q1UXM3_CLOBO|nr:thiolase family protein [Clostridium botulinum]AEB76026.1 acetyl-CoA acetyltransferase [Clostridium botulinum BKT015925]KEI00173.1 acetyl-CoA acetyltransferase [Clostridium botulinum C/D str. Sp77]KLU76527.1 acetyl-CoA acetyltransferase [Clostridium botulinum V891]KOA72832.1 acetyl-CoA acetyltransferase [Clostridium botulinum]KOA73921.1 acetyl-CoA acetyltransferase [Clostridium botulinum]
MSNNVYIVGGLRTPIGKTNGALKDILPEDLSAHLIKNIIDKYNIEPQYIEEVMLGNSVGPGGNLARLSLLQAGLPFSVVGTTIDFQCGSSLKAINMAASLIKSKERDLILVGGVESTSLAPNKQYNKRDYRYKGKDIFYKRAQFAPLTIGDPDMIEGAENTAKFFDIKRGDMDELAVESHLRALKANKEGKLKSIICNIKIGNTIISEDESIRKKISLNLVKRARPILHKEGSLTAANTCLTHDGGAILLMASEKAIKKYNLKPMAIWRGEASIGLDPNLSPLGATLAIENLIGKYNLNIENIDLIEINEAFSVKILAFLKKFKYPKEKINIYGGALAYGHPYGASGAIIMLHLLEGLKNEGGNLGIASLGVAGGLGIATLIERYHC